MPQNFLLFTAFTNKQYQISLHIVHNTTYFTEEGPFQQTLEVAVLSVPTFCCK